MTQFARQRRMTDQCTYWVQTGSGAYGATWSSPQVLPCNWMNDSEVQKDDTGAEFKPSAAFRLNGQSIESDGNGNVTLNIGGTAYELPKGARIIRGNYENESKPPASAQTIRKVVSKTKFRGDVGVTVYTG